MILLMFAVRDSATDSFGNPMFLVSTGQAIRSFRDEVNRKAEDNHLFVHPDDFEMFELGSFDTSTGRFALLEAPRSVLTAKSCKV
jgi:hypothetical protein